MDSRCFEVLKESCFDVPKENYKKMEFVVSSSIIDNEDGISSITPWDVPIDLLAVMNRFTDAYYKSLMANEYSIPVNRCEFVLDRTAKKRKYILYINSAEICRINNREGFKNFLISAIKLIAFYGVKYKF